jgi:chaperone BCS1
MSALFCALPERCIVLLEDIDTAGIWRDRSCSDTGAMSETHKDQWKYRSQVSLAGLLNVIDGAASREASRCYMAGFDVVSHFTQGRVLIMTTNRLDALDRPLIRPGRIDYKIGFTLATRKQFQEMYEQMYRTSATARIGSQRGGLDGVSHCGDDANDDEIAKETQVLFNDIAKLAQEFADAMPEHLFSPADIQSFLLERKADPRLALLDVGQWKDRQLEIIGEHCSAQS